MTHPYAGRAAVYVAALFNAIARADIEFNVRRAVALARLALVEGRHPVHTHATGFMSGMSDLGDDREVALGWGIGLVRLVAKTPRGSMWVLLEDEGTTSAGVRAEIAEWERCRNGHLERIGTWLAYEEAFRVAGLHAQWTELGPWADRRAAP